MTKRKQHTKWMYCPACGLEQAYDARFPDDALCVDCGVWLFDESYMFDDGVDDGDDEPDVDGFDE